MARAFIGLGSNLGNGRENLRLGWQQLAERQGVIPLSLSSPFLTRPLLSALHSDDGGGSAAKNLGVEALSVAWFTNAVGMLETDLEALELLRLMHQIEAAMGRDRNKSENRTLDLDLLYYDDLVCARPELVLPHPGIRNRLFVLAPLAELAPSHRHPVSGLTAAEMLAGLQQSGQTAQKTSWQEEYL